MKVGILAISKTAKELARQIDDALEESVLLDSARLGLSTKEILHSCWAEFEGFICIMAAGIVVRSIAPLLKDKYNDPCVLVLDPNGCHVISLLSGHLGGGNSLARKVASITGGTPVITTGSDSLNLIPLDLWMVTQNLICSDKKELTRVSSLLVNQGYLNFYSDIEVESLPDCLHPVKQIEHADLAVSHKLYPGVSAVFFRPKNLIIGTGCNRNTPASEFESAIIELCADQRLCIDSVAGLASIDKKSDEVGLLEFAASRNLPLQFFTREQINVLKNLEISFAALKAVGAIGVAEPAALLGGASDTLLCRKRKWKNITMAVALAPSTLSARVQDLKNI